MYAHTHTHIHNTHTHTHCIHDIKLRVTGFREISTGVRRWMVKILSWSTYPFVRARVVVIVATATKSRQSPPRRLSHSSSDPCPVIACRRIYRSVARRCFLPDDGSALSVRLITTRPRGEIIIITLSVPWKIRVLTILFIYRRQSRTVETTGNTIREFCVRRRTFPISRFVGTLRAFSFVHVKIASL